MGRFKVGERVESRFLFWGNCTFPWNGRVVWSGTCTVGDPACGFFRVALVHFGNELYHIAASYRRRRIRQSSSKVPLRE
jgi:hypothetical protein